jgi:hypothetical protein
MDNVSGVVVETILLVKILTGTDTPMRVRPKA